MSNRTAQANTAVRKAWEKEYDRVLCGEGTRDWTREQQQQIKEYGVAKDENGKAFRGHHMKSVEAFPEYQGDADNIQFLSATEHLEAHGGYFRNPTNGYYNPETGKTVSFGDGKYQKCEVIKLSDPVFVPKPEPKSTPKKASANEPKGRVKRAPSKAVSVIGKVADTAKGFYVKHQGAINTVGIIGAVVTEEVVRRKVLGGGSGGGSSVGKIAQAVSTGKEVVDRVSPVEHAVRGYTRMQNGKLVEVAPYVRGIKK